MPEASQKKKSRPKRNEALIPAWWMEVTPHHTLDLDDEKARRDMEERMAMYYANLAEEEAAKGMMFDIDGNPIEDNGGSGGGSSGDWKSNWTGRKKKDDSGAEAPAEKPKMFGGRNFKPGSPGWDPKQWGIDANDLDYDKYLSGSMLPPQFITAMNNFAKATGHFKSHSDYTSNLRSTEGTYGRLAEKQTHVPDWMKKKLRSTSQGASIRHGIYDDSPNRHWKGRDAAAEGGTIMEEGEEPEKESSQPQEQAPTPRQQDNHVSKPTPKPFTHKDYYYNSTTPNAGTQAATQQQEAFVDPDAAEYEEDETEYIEEVEEVVEYEEEVVEYEEEGENPAAEGGGELEDLQAKLASKMAELKRLQAM